MGRKLKSPYLYKDEDDTCIQTRNIWKIVKMVCLDAFLILEQKYSVN